MARVVPDIPAEWFSPAPSRTSTSAVFGAALLMMIDIVILNVCFTSTRPEGILYGFIGVCLTCRTCILRGQTNPCWMKSSLNRTAIHGSEGTCAERSSCDRLRGRGIDISRRICCGRSGLQNVSRRCNSVCKAHVSAQVVLYMNTKALHLPPSERNAFV